MMIKLTTKLLATDLIALGFEDQEGVRIQVRINPDHIVSYHPYPDSEGNGFNGTRIVTLTDQLLVVESAEEIDVMLEHKPIIAYKENADTYR